MQQTCIFNSGEGVTGEHLDGQLLDNLCWNSSGKLLAGSMDNMVNIWAIGGISDHFPMKTQCWHQAHFILMLRRYKTKAYEFI